MTKEYIKAFNDLYRKYQNTKNILGSNSEKKYLYH